MFLWYFRRVLLTMFKHKLQPLVATAVTLVVLGVAGCGSTTTSTSTVASGTVNVVVTAPTGGSVIAGSSVVVRGTVTPTNATVQVQGQPAAVGNGVFTGSAALHAGKNTIDVIGSAAGATPGSTSVVVVEQGSGSTEPQKSKPPSNASNAATPVVAHESDLSSCGGDLSVGPDTTCVFAEAVQSAYDASDGSGTVEAYSPVTKKDYEMTCVTSTTQVVCTGGIGASVYFSP